MLIKDKKPVREEIMQSGGKGIKKCPRLISADHQRDFIESKCCSEMERAGNDSKKVYSLVRELNQKSAARSDVIKDNDGTILTESDDIKARWAQYCCDLFTHKSPAEPITTDQEETDIEPPPLLEEIRQAMNELKMESLQALMRSLVNCKYSGEDGVKIMWEL